jgi:hypothetical protein
MRATAFLPTRRAVPLGIGAVLAGCGVAGCQGVNEADGARYTPEEIAQEVGLVADDTGASWTGPLGCHVSVIMTTRREVQTYVDAGDPVVTNTLGDVGFKFVVAPGCRKRLKAALTAVE